MGPGKDRARFAGLDTGVDESTGWTFGARAVRVMEIPAHTSSHIAFIVDDAAFTGDTLFAMGCGRLFEGTPAMMWSSLSKLMTLPDATRIFCGHEYTQSNGRFALTLEPDNAALVARMKDVDAARAKGRADHSLDAWSGKTDQSVPAPELAGIAQDARHGERERRRRLRRDAAAEGFVLSHA